MFQRAFSLIEIIIAITIIALFISLPVLAYSSYAKTGRDNKRKADVLKISQALEQYKAEKGSYPLQLEDLVTTGFLTELPIDPKQGQDVDVNSGIDYAYAYKTDGMEYELMAYLENDVPFKTGSERGRGVFKVDNRNLIGAERPFPELTDEAAGNPLIPTTTGYVAPTRLPSVSKTPGPTNTKTPTPTRTPSPTPTLVYACGNCGTGVLASSLSGVPTDSRFTSSAACNANCVYACGQVFGYDPNYSGVNGSQNSMSAASYNCTAMSSTRAQSLGLQYNYANLNACQADCTTAYTLQYSCEIPTRSGSNYTKYATQQACIAACNKPGYSLIHGNYCSSQVGCGYYNTQYACLNGYEPT